MLHSLSNAIATRNIFDSTRVKFQFDAGLKTVRQTCYELFIADEMRKISSMSQFIVFTHAVEKRGNQQLKSTNATLKQLLNITKSNLKRTQCLNLQARNIVDDDKAAL